MIDLADVRATLLLRHPFFGYLALKLILEPTEAVPIAATDATRLYYNPKALDQFSRDEWQTIIAHEVMHCALGHVFRENGREHVRWNIACDLCVNQELKAAGFTMPKIGLLDPKGADESAEQRYAKIKAITVQMSAGAEMGGMTRPSSGDAEGGQNQTMTEADWRVATIAAAKVAQNRGRGDLPAGIKRLIDSIVHPRPNLWDVLAQFVTRAFPADYTYSPPNKRYVSRGMYLPSIRRTGTPELVIGCDTSGSIDEKMLGEYLGALRELVEQVMPERTHVCYCDAKVEADVFERGEPFDPKPRGGGGTDFRPVFDYADKIGPACVIYLTDLDGQFPKDPPAYPVLWLTQRECKKPVPFGEVVVL